MIDVELAKRLIDKDFFRTKKQEGAGLLKDKLIQLVRMYMAKEESRDVEGDTFALYLTNDGIVYNSDGKTSQGYHNIGAEENGWSWGKITGPNHSSEYYYNEYFGCHNTTYFEFAYAIYFTLLRGRPLEGAKNVVNQVMAGTTIEEVEKVIDRLAYDGLDFQEFLATLEWDSEECNEEELDLLGGVKMLVLCAYYLYHYGNGTEMEEDLLRTMNASFSRSVVREELDAEEYMDCFLDVLQDTIECSMKGTRIILDPLLNVHFSYSMDQHEKTSTLFVYKSKPLKEYKLLREMGKDSILVSYMDRLVPMLEDPAFMFPGEELEYFNLEPESCVVNYGYTDEEYICGYYYYERQWETEREYVNYDFAFSIARKCFEVLLAQLKAEWNC